MTEITITVGEFLFQWDTFKHWVYYAQRDFDGVGLRSEHVLCIDAKGRVCDFGKQFNRARDENTFPVKVYRKVLP